MIPLLTLMISTGLLMIAIGISGLIFSRHFVLMLFSAEIMILASILLLVSFFATSGQSDADFVLVLFTLWVLAGVEAIALIAFYTVMKARGFGFDVKELSSMKW